MSAANEYRSSSPCLDCYRKMKELGVKRIIYSVTDGLVKINLKDYTPTCLSLGRQFIDNGYNTIFRDRKRERMITYNTDTDSYISDATSVGSDSSSTKSDDSYSLLYR